MEKTMGQPVHRLIDLYHLTKKLGEAAKILLLDDKQREQLMSRWKFQLLNRQQASEVILAEFEDSGLRSVRVGKGDPVKETMTYLENYHAQLDYTTARGMGLATASGPLEATCKSLVNQRFKRFGSRWKRTNRRASLAPACAGAQ